MNKKKFINKEVYHEKILSRIFGLDPYNALCL